MSVDSSEPLTFFLDLPKLENTTADGITSEILNCVLNHGLDDAYLKKVWWDSAQMEPL